VFLFDDDSLMYPDCAAEIMRVYDADTGRSVVGVNATNVAVPPDASYASEMNAPTEFTIPPRTMVLSPVGCGAYFLHFQQ
jgi:hypothetical protein